MDLQKLNNVSLLVVGDVGVDEYVMGAVRRISPEAPVPVVEVNNEDVRLGLSANVCQNITSLGGRVSLVSVVGDDGGAKLLRNLLKSKHVSDEFLIVDSTRPTTRKLRVMSGQHHLLRVDYEHKRYLDSKVEQQLVEKVASVIPQVQGVIIQDYAKGVLSESAVQRIIALAKKNNLRVFVDPNRSTPLRYYRGADIMTPNYDEAMALTGRSTDDLTPVSNEMREVGLDLMKGIESSQMVITRGKDGLSLFTEKGSQHVPTFARQVFDVTGAGDTFIATLAMGWVSGMSLEDACVLANHAAGIVVGKIGCVPCTRQELEASLATK